MGYSQCAVNAGGKKTLCGTSTFLEGTSEGTGKGIKWSVKSMPPGAVAPNIHGDDILTPEVTGMNTPGEYVFTISKTCKNNTVSTNDVTITSTGDTSKFTAGSDITTIWATTGTVDLQGVIPEGYEGEWSAVNLYTLERLQRSTDENSKFSDIHSATPTFSLIKKADHDIDPAYKLTLRIKSKFNATCKAEKSIIVRFIPNPKLEFKENDECTRSDGKILTYLSYQKGSPKFATLEKSVAGNPAFGTSITLIDIEQPQGGNLTYAGLIDNSFLGINTSAAGVYKFKLFVQNDSGKHTSQEIIYIRKGVAPGRINFIDPSYPEQKMEYAGGGTGGELQCNLAGKDNVLYINFSLDEKDNPKDVVNTFSVNGIIPKRGAPTLKLLNDGERKRAIEVTPPAGGWHIGTYQFSIETKNGECGISTNYYIHISDGERPNVEIEDVFVCYSGSGVVDNVEVMLPKIYKGVVEKSYFQEYSGEYKIVSENRPDGAEIPTSQEAKDRNLESKSTLISNFTMPGEYVFSIKAESLNGTDWLLEEEYLCSGTSREATFTINVSGKVGANAGNDQTDVYCRSRTVLIGNAIKGSKGQWIVKSAPPKATIANIEFSNEGITNRTIVSGLDITGTYVFSWNLGGMGACNDADDVEVEVYNEDCKKPYIITNPMMTSKTIKRRK